MAHYVQNVWTNNVTPVDKAHMDVIEAGITEAADLYYLGDWVAGTYKEGDIVVYNGVAYMAVRQTTQTPVPWGTPPYGNPPGYEFGYDQITAAVTVSSTTEASGTTVIACAAHTFDGAAVIAEFFSQNVLPAAAANALVVIGLFEGATQIGRFGLVQSPNIASGIQVPFYGRLRLTPSAASHTYTVTAWQSGGSGTIQAGAGGAGANSPAFVRFTKV